MNNQHNATQAGTHAPINDKAPDAANARGPKNNTSKCLNFNQHAEQVQGKRYTFAIVADLTLYAAKELRELLPNRRALMALDLAQAMCCRYLIAAGQLMASNAEVFAMTLASDADIETLTASVLAAHSQMSEISDTTTWTLLLSNEVRDVVAQALEATQS